MHMQEGDAENQAETAEELVAVGNVIWLDSTRKAYEENLFNGFCGNGIRYLSLQHAGRPANG